MKTGRPNYMTLGQYQQLKKSQDILEKLAHEQDVTGHRLLGEDLRDVLRPLSYVLRSSQ
jgi:hypothetical protein